MSGNRALIKSTRSCCTMIKLHAQAVFFSFSSPGSKKLSQVTGTLPFRPCLLRVAMGDPGLVVSFFFSVCPPERKNIRNQPH